MTPWSTVLLACGFAYALKFAGYVVPHRLLEAPRVRAVTALLPVALLAALVGVQTFSGASPQTLALDSRVVAVGVAIVALALRASFILVVVLGAATAALLRHLGWG